MCPCLDVTYFTVDVAKRFHELLGPVGLPSSSVKLTVTGQRKFLSSKKLRVDDFRDLN